MFQMVMVTSMELNGGFDVLIGMDILGLGDFAVTHQNGNTTFSFCCPSLREIDFVKELEAKDAVLPVHSSKISRNSPCPCGSGKKHKKCCGDQPQKLKATTPAH